ncbi:Alpha/Beta hydrolase protein [Aspergillus ambiguus]|uniref:Alpha/Beta hydrolase protein n=1 Tax=Aspergillus ambiguus TaxID=176160 RepID=UPI003CCD71F1
MSLLTYLYLKIVVTVLHVVMRLQGMITAAPDTTLHLPSRDPSRSIKAHLYRSTQSTPQTPTPVLINFPGIGFVVSAHGGDDAFCRRISQQTAYSVLDIDYRLSPEHPFPAPVHDTEDVVKWVLRQAEKFDVSRVAVSGFSAGGNLALVASSYLFPPTTFRAVLVFYPSVSLYIDPATLVRPETGGSPMPTFLLRLFNKCYIPAGVDARDLRLSPSLAESESFPRNMLIITASYDTLADEAEKLGRRLAQDAGRYVVRKRMDQCDHTWDKFAREGSPEWERKEQAYGLAVDMLSR